MHAVIVEARVVEVAKHGLVGGMLHGKLVLRGAPQVCLRSVAAGAGFAADKRRCLQQRWALPPEEMWNGPPVRN